MLNTFKLSLVAAFAFCLHAADATAGKPSPPASSPVRYQIQFWTAPGSTLGSILQIHETNSRFQTVGAYTPSDYYSPITDVRAFLYDPAYPAQAVDLNLIVSGLRPGWRLHVASAINETGLIAAHAVPNDTSSSQRQAVVVDLNRNPPCVIEIPDRGFTDYSLYPDINDRGEIVAAFRIEEYLFGHYECTYDPISGTISAPQILPVLAADTRWPRINNAGDIVGMENIADGYRISRNGPIERFSGLIPKEINESGVFCGRATVVTGKRKNATSQYAFLYGNSLLTFTQNSFAVDLNETNDFISHDVYTSLNHRQYGNLLIKDLLDPADSSLIEYKSRLFVDTLSERMHGTGFPILTGRYQGLGVQLFPVAP